jgi:hypothetical protein
LSIGGITAEICSFESLLPVQKQLQKCLRTAHVSSTGNLCPTSLASLSGLKNFAATQTCSSADQRLGMTAQKLSGHGFAIYNFRESRNIDLAILSECHRKTKAAEVGGHVAEARL